ncbi:SAP domain-containing protein [Williamsia soli]|uniref:SAP domain-containing protein n=1 Tax=Williamsia soli TaxID=364929 RepID=UPI001A9CF650|nr:SAP domain-containing protein [Williamsia soli]
METVPIEVRLKGSLKGPSGLYPHEVLMLSYAPGFTTASRKFQGFWWYQYGVSDPHALLTDLAARGFLTPGTAEQAVEAQTVATLKEFLRAHKLIVSGRKSSLVQRVMTSISADSLDKQFPERYYMLTPTGEDALKLSPQIPYIHHHPNIITLNIFTVDTAIVAYSGRWRDGVWRHLNEQLVLEAVAGNWGHFRNCRLFMAKFIAEESRYLEALTLLADVVYFDLTGMGNKFSLEHLDITAEFLFPYERSLATLSPGVVSMIFNWARIEHLDDAGLQQLLQDRIVMLGSPLRLFTTEQIVSIVFLERDQKLKELTALYTQAEKAFVDTYRIS